MKLEPGMLIRTSYDTGPYRIARPYRIRRVYRGCTCPLYTDRINLRHPPAQPPHLHLELTDSDGRGEYWINHVDEDSLTVLYANWDGSHDCIEVLPPDKPVQLSLF